MTKAEFFDAVWSILVEHAGAYDGPHQRETFLHLQCKEHVAEYRFGGKLGFGGKFWRNASRFYVSAYPEDVTPKIAAVIKRTNARLDALVAKHPETLAWT